ncbi:barstar family protein [Actinokineospora sp. HUAS TT18]|uniref:barstar family protein n=1 Tax=Actinokineospora sp. HUAS TT18 TaxID=3447451 RepID=UPI003F527005
MGQAINGPGGYFGRNLDALSDCLCGRFGHGNRFGWCGTSAGERHIGVDLR